MRNFFLALLLSLGLASSAYADFHYSKAPAYDVISRGPAAPHIHSNITSGGYVRIYIQYHGDIYVMRKLRDSVSVKPMLQKLDAESAAFVRAHYEESILLVNALDTLIIVDHDTAGTYQIGQNGRIGWNGHGGSSSSSGGSTSGSSSTGGSSSGGTCPPGQRRGAGGTDCHTIPLCEIMHTCGGSSSGGSSSSGASSSSSSGASGSSSSSSGGSTSSSSSGGGSTSSSSSSGGSGVTLCYPPAGRVVNVSGPGALQAALNAASAGDHLVLASGTYGGMYTFSKNGTASAPIVIQGNGSQTFTGTFNMGGSYTVLKGMRFTGDGFRVVLTGNHNRITKNLFANVSADGAIRLDGAHSNDRIDHNEFRTFAGAAVRGNIHSALDHQNQHIDHNYFFDHTVRGDNESVMLMLTDAYHDSYLTYEYNLFDKVLQGTRHQNELITTKTAKSVIRGNTVINSPNVAFSLRETNRTLVEGNYLLDGAGISVLGDDHIIRNNYISSAGKITVRGGDGTMDTPNVRPGCKPGMHPILENCKGVHPAARRALVADNIAKISVGDVYDGNTFPAENTTLRNNSGAITLTGRQTGTTRVDGTPSNNARRLGLGDVGIGAADVSCSGN